MNLRARKIQYSFVVCSMITWNYVLELLRVDPARSVLGIRHLSLASSPHRRLKGLSRMPRMWYDPASPRHLAEILVQVSLMAHPFLYVFSHLWLFRRFKKKISTNCSLGSRPNVWCSSPSSWWWPGWLACLPPANSCSPSSSSSSSSLFAMAPWYSSTTLTVTSTLVYAHSEDELICLIWQLKCLLNLFQLLHYKRELGYGQCHFAVIGEAQQELPRQILRRLHRRPHEKCTQCRHMH